MSSEWDDYCDDDYGYDEEADVAAESAHEERQRRERIKHAGDPQYDEDEEE